MPTPQPKSNPRAYPRPSHAYARTDGASHAQSDIRTGPGDCTANSPADAALHTPAFGITTSGYTPCTTDHR